MRILVTLGLFALTALLLGGSLHLAMVHNPQWSYFLAGGLFSFIISAAVTSNLTKDWEEYDDEDVEPGE